MFMNHFPIPDSFLSLLHRVGSGMQEIAEQRKRPAPEVDDLDAEGPAKKRIRNPNSIDLLEKNSFLAYY